MVVFNSRGEVLVGERLNFLGSWQFPQGGIDDDEDPIKAAMRELYEEVGIDSGKIVAEYPDWISYDFPENLPLNRHLQKYRGNFKSGFLFIGTEKWINVIWIFMKENLERFVYSYKNTLNTVVPFKKDVYYKIVNDFGPKIQNFLQDIGNRS